MVYLGVEQGLICVVSCVEPCQTFSVQRCRLRKQLELVAQTRKCLHLYFYFMDREFGLMHIRLQTWLPMMVQVCINGREWLARALDRAGVAYVKNGNCFTQIDDVATTQRLLDQLTGKNWTSFLNALARRVNPWLAKRSGLSLRSYYWTMRETEYATDVMFRDAQAVSTIYPSQVDHALRHFHRKDALRFLGRRTNSRFRGEVTGDIKHRPEGMRIKHWVEENSIKMYNKKGSVLRIETTINNPRRFKVRRRATRNGQTCMAWLPMRRGVADMSRRVDISRAANERYLEALGVVGASAPTRHLTDPVSKRITRKGRPYRALRPIDPEEARLFDVLLRGQFLVQGFRNRDVRQTLYPRDERLHDSRRKASGRTTRLLRLLRVHGLIRKVSHTFYYRITQKGHYLMTTALKLRQIDLRQLAA